MSECEQDKSSALSSSAPDGPVNDSVGVEFTALPLWVHQLHRHRHRVGLLVPAELRVETERHGTGAAVTTYWSHSKPERQSPVHRGCTRIPCGGVLTGCFHANGVLEVTWRQTQGFERDSLSQLVTEHSETRPGRDLLSGLNVRDVMCWWFHSSNPLLLSRQEAAAQIFYFGLYQDELLPFSPRLRAAAWLAGGQSSPSSLFEATWLTNRGSSWAGAAAGSSAGWVWISGDAGLRRGCSRLNPALKASARASSSPLSPAS